MSGALNPSVMLLCKLGSAIVHAEELLSPDSHAFDQDALRAILADPEVSAWISQMNEMALLPLKRSARGEQS